MLNFNGHMHEEGGQLSIHITINYLALLAMYSSPIEKLENHSLKFLLIGPSGAGKLALLHSLKMGDVATTTTTPEGFTIDALRFNNLELVSWDIERQEPPHQNYQKFYQNVNAIIYMVSSCDVDKVVDAKDKLHAMLEDQRLRNAHLLVFASQYDQPCRMAVPELVDMLGLHRLRGRNWFIQACCLKSGDGVDDGCAWLTHQF